MLVVADSSPLVALAAIKHMHILPQLFGRIAIPEAVWSELQAGSSQSYRTDLLAANWLDVKACGNMEFVLQLRIHLGAGESEAIALSLEHNADVLLMDERLGRRTAMHHDLHPLGTAGILLLARQHGIITAIHPLLTQLRNTLGFRLSDQVVASILESAGE